MTTSTGFGELRLAAAERHFSGMAVTAFLTEVEIVACSAVGVVHKHTRAGAGRFEDGHRIRTSDIHLRAHRSPYWILLTASGSCYVIVTFKGNNGRRSLNDFLKVLTGGFYPTPRHLQ